MVDSYNQIHQQYFMLPNQKGQECSFLLNQDPPSKPVTVSTIKEKCIIITTLVDLWMHWSLKKILCVQL